MTDQVKEAQLKLGYAKETVRLYYPVDSLNTILGIINNSLENIQLTTRLKQKGSEMASDAKTKISSWFHKDEVEGKLSESLETASGEDSGVGSLFEEAEKEISNKIKLTFKDTTGKDVTGVTVKITPNEGAIRKFMEMRTLTKQVLNELIDHIDVCETQGTGKTGAGVNLLRG